MPQRWRFCCCSPALAFRILRDGTPIGIYVTEVQRSGSQFVLETKIDVEIPFAFIRLYSYRHRSPEEWERGRLVRFVSATGDNGTTYRVDGRAIAAEDGATIEYRSVAPNDPVGLDGG